MPNEHILQRLTGLQAILNGVHQSGNTMSYSSRGSERDGFINEFLAQVMPPIYRFGTGDVTDIEGNRSGQLDVVVEYPFLPSLPIRTGSQRLYLAESVAAVIEVKSNMAAQWDEAVNTASQLATVQRRFRNMTIVAGCFPLPTIPLFVVGYKGWRNIETIKHHVDADPSIAGALAIEPGLFYSKPPYGGITADGPWSLWGLISNLHRIASGLESAPTDPATYGI
jgi:hypothetical protein